MWEKEVKKEREGGRQRTGIEKIKLKKYEEKVAGKED